MKNNYLIYILVSFLFGFIFWISTTQLFISVVIALIFLFYFILRTERLIKKEKHKQDKIHLAYNLINNVVTSISVYQNATNGIEKVFETLDLSRFNEIGDLSQMSGSEKLKYLSTFFNLPIYEAFLNVIQLYEDNGGNILDMSEYVLNEIKQIEVSVVSLNKYNRSKMISIGSIWAFALIVPIFIRFALTDFFSSLANSVVYIVGIVIIFGLILFTIEFISIRIKNQRIKGVDL